MKEKCRICKDVLNKDEEDNFCESCTRDMITMLSEPWEPHIFYHNYTTKESKNTKQTNKSTKSNNEIKFVKNANKNQKSLAEEINYCAGTSAQACAGTIQHNQQKKTKLNKKEKKEKSKRHNNEGKREK